MMGHAGFDAVVIDWQHGVGVSQESVVACIQAIGSSAAVPIVRLPRNSPEYISYVLRRRGVWRHRAHGQHVCRSGGRRSRLPVCAAWLPQHRGQPADLSEPLEAYVQRANDDVICLVMVETTKAGER